MRNMDTSLIVAFASLVLASVSIGITYFSLKKVRLEIPLQLDTLAQKVGEGLREHVDAELQPIKHVSSRVMSDRGTLGATAKQMKKVDELIGEDIINMQSPEIKVIMDLFPNLGEYARANPHLIGEILPRLQALQGDKNFKLMDLLGKGSPSPSSRTRQPHPLGNE